MQVVGWWGRRKRRFNPTDASSNLNLHSWRYLTCNDTVSKRSLQANSFITFVSHKEEFCQLSPWAVSYLTITAVPPVESTGPHKLDSILTRADPAARHSPGEEQQVHPMCRGSWQGPSFRQSLASTCSSSRCSLQVPLSVLATKYTCLSWRAL